MEETGEARDLSRPKKRSKAARGRYRRTPFRSWIWECRRKKLSKSSSSVTERPSRAARSTAASDSAPCGTKAVHIREGNDIAVLKACRPPSCEKDANVGERAPAPQLDLAVTSKRQSTHQRFQDLVLP